MKKTMMIIATVAICTVANATLRTVSNNANSPGQYTDLQVAATAAAANDTLYVSGSQTGYGNITLIKPVTIIGAGALPNKDYYFATLIGNIALNYNALYTASASGSKIMGCEVSSISFACGDNTVAHPGISNVILTRNRIGSIGFNSCGYGNPAVAINNISIYNNVISYIGGDFIKNSIIRNNIIWGISSVGSVNAGTMFITNNVILSNLNSCSSLTINNNIFYSTAASSAVTSNTFCTFSNNCFFSPTHPYVLADIIIASNTSTNNILNQDPMFVYYDALAILPYSYTQLSPVAGPFADFNLSAGSPCHLTGSDGLDIGMYGGLSIFVEGYPANSRYRYYPMPAIPQMLNMFITNGAIQPAGTLNVNFKARKQD